jgi:hypothetical protein
VRDGTLYAFRLHVVRSHAGLARRGQSVRDARQPTDARTTSLSTVLEGRVAHGAAVHRAPHSLGRCLTN